MLGRMLPVPLTGLALLVLPGLISGESWLMVLLFTATAIVLLVLDRMPAVTVDRPDRRAQDKPGP